MRTVLVVDDDMGIRKVLYEVLTMEGYTVQTAEHGGPALNILRASSEPMVVLLGLAMPVVDGEAVLEAVAADEELAPRHAFAMVTGSRVRATTGRVATLREQLEVPFIAKPFTVGQILSALEEAERRLDARARG
jgi:CheY-like chemotaxis protein